MARKAASPEGETQFTKQQLIESARYRNRRDLVAALIDDQETCSIAELDQRMEKYLKGKVN